MLRDHILSSLPWHLGQPFPLLGEGSMRRLWQRNTERASCCALGWSTSPGLEVVFGLLRTGEQFSDKEHHFTSRGEPKCRGVYSEQHLISPDSCCPLANLCLLLQLGYSHFQESQKFQIFRRCPSWVQEDFFSSDPSSIIHLNLAAGPSCAFQSSTDHGSSLLCPAWLPTSCLCFKCFADDPRRNKPKSQQPQKQSLESKQLQLVISSWGGLSFSSEGPMFRSCW